MAELLAFPNVSEGRDEAAIEAIAQAFAAGGARVLDQHSDADHNRTAFTLAGEPGQLALAVLGGAEEAVARIDMTRHEGVHPYVGALDVAAMVHLDDATARRRLRRGAGAGRRARPSASTCRSSSTARSRRAASGPSSARGGLPALAQRMAAGEQHADFGPQQPHTTAGATLVAARPPLVAFNLVLDRRLRARDGQGDRRARSGRADPRDARLQGHRRRADRRRRAGQLQRRGPPRDPARRDRAGGREATPRSPHAELVGLAPKAAFDGFPDDLPIPGFDPQRHLI